MKSHFKKKKKTRKNKVGRFLLFLGLTALVLFLVIVFGLILPCSIGLACKLGFWHIAGIIATIAAYLFFIQRI
ncbi:MAG: hypothetical protein ACJAYJ_003072 [Saprospiraceae bacterium]